MSHDTVAPGRAAGRGLPVPGGIPANGGRPCSAAPAVRVRGVRRSFEAGMAPVRALRGLGLDVAIGEFVALMGPSGCGKSILLNVIAGLDQPDEGSIEVADAGCQPRPVRADPSDRGLDRRERAGPGRGRRVLPIVAASDDVARLNDARIAVAQSGQVSITVYTYHPVDGKRMPVVVTTGQMPADPGEIVLAPTTARELHAAVGSAVRLTGGAHPGLARVSGIGFVPEGPHNEYDSGAWMTPAGYDRLFRGAHYSFKFHIWEVTLRPGASVAGASRRLEHAAMAVKGAQGLRFVSPAVPQAVLEVKDVAVLPFALGGFLVLLAVGPVGQALATAVRRRRHELAVLRALGITRLQSRLVVVTQASVLAAIGLVFGVPLGVALGRITWRLVAQNTPLAYHPPLAAWALALIGPLALLIANLLATWPGQRAARLRCAQILRAE